MSWLGLYGVAIAMHGLGFMIDMHEEFDGLMMGKWVCDQENKPRE